MNNEYYTFNEYIKNNKLSPSEEDYIEMIYRLYLENKTIKVAEVALALNVKIPSASKMVKRLSDKNLLEHERYGCIYLSCEGKRIGKKLLKRHDTIESFLKIIGVQNNLHEETEKIEHTIREETLEKISLLVDFLGENKSILKEFKDYILDRDDAF